MPSVVCLVPNYSYIGLLLNFCYVVVVASEIYNLYLTMILSSMNYLAGLLFLVFPPFFILSFSFLFSVVGSLNENKKKYFDQIGYTKGNT